MSFFADTMEVLKDWDKEKYGKLHHEDFLFIRETELYPLNDYLEIMEEFMISGGGPEVSKRMAEGLIHENEYVCELRWEDNGEIVTNVFMEKDGLAWRSIVNRVTKKSTH